MSSFSGYIVACPAARQFSVGELEMTEAEVTNGPTLRFQVSRFGLREWEEYILTSPVPLSDETEGAGRFDYPMFIVRGFSKLVVIAARRRIVDYALAKVLDRVIFPNLRKVNVFVDQLIEHCQGADSEFLITSLHGRFSGPATHLRSISLYGDDVTQSSIYEEHHELFNFHSSGIGRRPSEKLPHFRQEEGEIVRIANDGFINLNLTTRQRAQELTNVVAFIMAHRWVEDWVPLTKGE